MKPKCRVIISLDRQSATRFVSAAMGGALHPLYAQLTSMRGCPAQQSPHSTPSPGNHEASKSIASVSALEEWGLRQALAVSKFKIAGWTTHRSGVFHVR